MFVLLRGIMKALFAHGWFRNEFFYRSAKCPQQRYDRERQDASKWLYFSLKIETIFIEYFTTRCRETMTDPKVEII